jgi:3'-5' exoribonuclease
MFPEALMLHYLDDLDSKMESMRAHFQREPGAEWTTYNASLARPLLNSKNFLEKMQPGNNPAPAVQPGAVQPDSVLTDNVLESPKAAAAKEK